MFELFDTHRDYLSDGPRMAAFEQAIQTVVHPGDVVLDLGCGTGIMGLLACRAGARRVYAIDEGGIVGVARDVARANEFSSRIQFLRGHSTRIDLPEKVDVVVADQIGRFGYEAGLFPSYADARRRFLKPGGKLIPGRLDLWIAPVSCARRWADASFWGTTPAGFDFSPALGLAMNTTYPVSLAAADLLAPPTRGASIALLQDDLGLLRVNAEAEIQSAGMLNGIGGWFEAELSPGVRLTNSPLSSARIDRRNAFLPIRESVAVQPGDRVRMTVVIQPADLTASWRVQVTTQGGVSGPPAVRNFAHSTLLGTLLSEEDVRKTHPDSRPQLTAWGRARSLALQLADGQHTRAQIEQLVQKQFSELFPGAADVAGFISRVLDSDVI